LAGLIGSGDPGIGIVVGYLALDVSEHPRLIVIAGQGLVRMRSLYMSGDRALIVGTD